MKKLVTLLMFTLLALAVQAQILTPVKWNIKLEDSESAEKTLIFSAKLDAGWHLYDMNLPEGGPISTSFSFENLIGAKTIGTPVASKEATTVFEEQFQMELRWFAGEVSFRQKIEETATKHLQEGG